MACPIGGNADGTADRRGKEHAVGLRYIASCKRLFPARYTVRRSNAHHQSSRNARKAATVQTRRKQGPGANQENIGHRGLTELIVVVEKKHFFETFTAGHIHRDEMLGVIANLEPA